MHRNLFRNATQSHHFKYAAAVREESRLVHPRWASRIVAPALGYLPSGRDATTELHARSRRLLRKVGM